MSIIGIEIEIETITMGSVTERKEWEMGHTSFIVKIYFLILEHVRPNR